jgi:hypothetical protein
LEQAPSAIFEILCLARELKTPKEDQIAVLIDDVIGVTMDDPDAWLKFKNWPPRSTETQFSAQRREICLSDYSAYGRKND